MADATLGGPPEAIARRQADVVISDGSTVKVFKWSWAKFQKLITLVGNLSEAKTLAIESVAESDRAKVEELEGEDILAISTAASDLNATPAALKNLQALLRQSRDLGGALGIQKSPIPTPQ
jgi:hypothetical protein